MTRLPLTKLAPIVLLAGCGAQRAPMGGAMEPPSPLPPTAEAHRDWEHDYWDMYGLIAEGSMWNPEAFSALQGEPPEDELSRVEIEMEIVEVAEPVEEGDEVDLGVFVEPTLSAACGLTDPEVYFAFDSDRVREQADATLSRLAECLEEPPLDDAYLSITGHTDPRGTEEYNRELGLDRADAVAEALVERGLEAERIDTYSRGEYFASSDPERWPSDRHVSIALDR